MRLFHRNKKGPTYRYESLSDQDRAARHLICNLNAGKVNLGERTYLPGSETMLPDENGVPVFVQYVGVVDGKAKWKEPDRFVNFGKKGKGRKGDGGMVEGPGGRRIGKGMEIGGFHQLNQEPIDVPLNRGMNIGSGAMRGGAQSAHNAPRPIFGSDMVQLLGMTNTNAAPGPGFGGGFGMGASSQQSHGSSHFSHQGQTGLPPVFGQGAFNQHSEGHYDFGHRSGTGDPTSPRHSQSYTFPRGQTIMQDFSSRFALGPIRSPFMSSFHQQPAQQFQPPRQEPQKAFAPPSGIVDPLATQQGPLGMHGVRAYVPGQTELQENFPGSQTDPEQRYKYLAALEKLRKENEKKGMRG